MRQYRKIIFKGQEGRYDVPSFTLSDNESLCIELAVPQTGVGVYYATFQLGALMRRERLTRSRVVELSADWLNLGRAGSLICELELRDVAGVVVYKKYHIEPLNISEGKVGTEYYAAVQALEEENAELRKELGEVKAEIIAIKASLENIPALIEKAKKEAVIEATGGDPMRA